MNEDSLLFGIVFAVWLALAIVYATVPMFAMPGYAVVWGWGALVFLGLAALVAVASRRSHRQRE
jgi:membrane protein implicated in regulation of membrane protease activity